MNTQTNEKTGDANFGLEVVISAGAHQACHGLIEKKADWTEISFSQVRLLGISGKLLENSVVFVSTKYCQPISEDCRKFIELTIRKDRKAKKAEKSVELDAQMDLIGANHG